MTKLSIRLREATADLHRDAEHTPFMQRLLRGRADLPAYAAYLGSLLQIYRPLEAGLHEQRDAPAFAGLPVASLRRSEALAADLAALAARGAGAGDPTAAGDAYARRLDADRRERPPLLLAHVYVRYLGDLAGGQVLRRVVAKAFDAPTAVYDFEGDGRALVSAVRDVLDAGTLDEALADAVVDEAVLAFRLHIDLFRELEARTSA